MDKYETWLVDFDDGEAHSKAVLLVLYRHLQLRLDSDEEVDKNGETANSRRLYSNVLRIGVAAKNHGLAEGQWSSSNTARAIDSMEFHMTELLKSWDSLHPSIREGVNTMLRDEIESPSVINLANCEEPVNLMFPSPRKDRLHAFKSDTPASELFSHIRFSFLQVGEPPNSYYYADILNRLRTLNKPKVDIADTERQTRIAERSSVIQIAREIWAGVKGDAPISIPATGSKFGNYISDILDAVGLSSEERNAMAQWRKLHNSE